MDERSVGEENDHEFSTWCHKHRDHCAKPPVGTAENEALRQIIREAFGYVKEFRDDCFEHAEYRSRADALLERMRAAIGEKA